MRKHSQDQFLDVIDRDEAERRFHAALDLAPLGEVTVPLGEALGRVLSRDVVARFDVPGFDRSNVDGFAVRAVDTQGAGEQSPRRLQLRDAAIVPGVVPDVEVIAGTAVPIATGGMLPRGADAVVMVEHAEIDGDELLVARVVAAGSAVAFAGTDVAAGEMVVSAGQGLTSRETGVLAAVGAAEVTVYRRVKVAVISTGDEIIAPGDEMKPGLVCDSNARILADAIHELGGEPLELGIVRDDAEALRQRLREAIDAADVVLLSGGTSKGQGDICYRIVAERTDPGIVVHGVALKPGKPLCLAVTQGKPVVILPGFPTSAIFTFHEFVAPVIRRLGGLADLARSHVTARMAVKVNSEIGRTEYLLVGLVAACGFAKAMSETPNSDTAPTTSPAVELTAFPMGKGSGSVTTFSRADGFVTIDRHQEIVEAGTIVDVQLLGRDLKVADLVVIGSHCAGLDYLRGRLQAQGLQTKFLSVGSTAGLDAAKRGECDVAGIHLLDEKTNQYNRPFLTDDLLLVPGYGRQQGIVFRPGDARFENLAATDAADRATDDEDCVMVNRNQGSGTRILIDRLLGGRRPRGYAVQAKNHTAVAAAVAQGRADWGVTISPIAQQAALGFLPLADEQLDFVVPKSRRRRPAVVAFCDLLAADATRQHLKDLGFTLDSPEP